jgi:hypothetical protein
MCNAQIKRMEKIVMKIQGLEFPMATKQSSHNHSDITGRVWADYFRMRELPAEKDFVWSEKGFNRVHNFAQFRAEQKGQTLNETLHKTRWMVLMNRPSTYVMYTNKLDDTQLGIIKFCLTHGIPVALEDCYMQYKEILKPVINLHQVELFKTFKVEQIDLNKIPADMVQSVAKKRQILEDERKKFMADVWNDVNSTMAEINDFYALDKIETSVESRIWADRYRTDEILKLYGATITVYDLDKPEVIDTIMKELSIWAHAFDINVKLHSGECDVHTFKPSHWYKNPVRSKVTELKIVQKIKQGMRPSDLNELVSAYMQVQFYKEATEQCDKLTEDGEYWIEYVNPYLSPDYFICSDCQHPVNKKAAVCNNCGLPNTDAEPETISYELYSYKLEADSDC